MKCNADTGRRTTTTTRQRYSNGTATLSELDAMHPPTTALYVPGRTVPLTESQCHSSLPSTRKRHSGELIALPGQEQSLARAQQRSCNAHAARFAVWVG